MRYLTRREWWLNDKLELVPSTDPAKSMLFAKAGTWVDGLTAARHQLRERESQNEAPRLVKRKKHS